MPERVRITDVSPRDGLQNEAGVISTPEKVSLIERLARTGVDEIEVTSFVSRRWVPQLGDAREVVAALGRLPAGAPLLSALVPNEAGMRALLEANAAAGRGVIGKASVFTAASETFSKRNTNATIGETIERFGPVMALARGAGLAVRGYVSCVIACPFEGPIAPAKVVEVCERLIALGVAEIDLGDTIGAGTPETIAALLEAYGARVGAARGPAVTLHLHDTFGRAAECVKAALAMGVRSFDGAAGGLGGCPYASRTRADGSVERAPGNISTDLLIRTVHAAGFETGVNPAALRDAALLAAEIVGRSRREG